MSSTNWTFDPTIPFANNSPSSDQPKMLANNVSTNGILAVDHIGFNAGYGGNHLQMHMPSYSISHVAVSTAANEGSVVYTGKTAASPGNPGQADPNHAQLYFTIDNLTAPLMPQVNLLVSAVRAFGSIQIAPNSATILNGMNFTVMTNAGGTITTITLTPNVTTGGAYTIIALAENGQTIIVSKANNQFTVTAFIVPYILNFVVLQI